MPEEPTKPLDMARKIKTRDGREVEILRHGLKLSNSDSIVAIVTNHDGSQSVRTYQSDGSYTGGDSNPLDLVNDRKVEHRYYVVKPSIKTGLSAIYGPYNEHFAAATVRNSTGDRSFVLRVTFHDEELHDQAIA